MQLRQRHTNERLQANGIALLPLLRTICLKKRGALPLPAAACRKSTATTVPLQRAGYCALDRQQHTFGQTEQAGTAGAHGAAKRVAAPRTQNGVGLSVA
jgi:hypothetical protein